MFVNYASGFERDTRSNLNKALKSFKESKIQEIDGYVVSFLLLSSDPSVLVEQFEVLEGESLVSNTNSFREASAIINKLLRMKENTETE